jgi:hypothetical protein
MSTVLQEYFTEEWCSVVRFLWAKGFNAHFSSRKALHIFVEKFLQGRSKVAGDARPVAEVAETTVKRLLCCGFRRTGKAMGQCWWKISQEINIFSKFEYHMFYVLYPFVTSLLTLPRTEY